MKQSTWPINSNEYRVKPCGKETIRLRKEPRRGSTSQNIKARRHDIGEDHSDVHIQCLLHLREINFMLSLSHKIKNEITREQL